MGLTHVRSDTLSTTTAQVEATQAPETPAQETQAPAVPEGVQKRFDEMTAEKHALQRQIEEAKARENMYLAEIAARAQAPQPAQQPQVQIDPDVQSAMDAKFAAYEKRMSAVLNQLQGQQAVLQVRTGAAQQGLPDPIRVKAEEITLQYARQGYTIEPNVAFDLAAGQVYREQLEKQRQGNALRQNFNQPNPLMTHQNGVPAPIQGSPAQRPNFEQHLDGTPEGLQRYMQALEQAGVHNTPF